MFLVARLILGMGIPFCISGASALIAELAYPREASVLNGLFNESWYVGAIIAAGVTLGTYAMPNNWAWRIPSLLQIAPSVLQLTFIWFVPESVSCICSLSPGLFFLPCGHILISCDTLPPPFWPRARQTQLTSPFPSPAG